MQNTRTDVLITIDVREVLSGPDVNNTKLPPRAECSGRDFEDWIVPEEDGQPMCILGSTHTFRRMIRTPGDDGCFLPKDYSFPNLTTNVCALCHLCALCLVRAGTVFRG
jgi:hypothetical protein